MPPLTPWEKLDEAKRLLREEGRHVPGPAVRQALQLIEEATAPIDPTKRHCDGPYRADLAAAFREGARQLVGERVNVDTDALVEEGEGGVVVHCTVFVSDSERPLMPGEEAGQPRYTAMPQGGPNEPFCVWDSVEQRPVAFYLTSGAAASAADDWNGVERCATCGGDREVAPTIPSPGPVQFEPCPDCCGRPGHIPGTMCMTCEGEA